MGDIAPPTRIPGDADTCEKSSHHSLSDEAEPEIASVFGLRHSESDVYLDFCHMCLEKLTAEFRPKNTSILYDDQVS